MLVVASWLQEFLKRRLTPEQMVQAMEAAGIEVEGVRSLGEAVIDISTAANRADLNSLIGIAREVAAHSNNELRIPKAANLKPGKPRSFTIQAKQAVKRYGLVELSLKKPVGDSPAWLKKRLKLSGVRPVNLVADITNYCMWVFGQPMHAFDKDAINGKFVIRFAKPGERLQTLDGKVRQLTTKDLVIADNSGVIDLAGVMGGQQTEITARTNRVWLTVPVVDGTTIRQTSVRLGLRTEASARFERGIPAAGVWDTVSYALQLLKDLIGIEFDHSEDATTVQSKPTVINVRPERLGQLAGIPISKTEVHKIQALGFKVDGSSKELKVTAPYWRPDVSNQADVFEEVIKLIGLDKLPTTLPSYQPHKAHYDDYWPKLWAARNLLAGLGGFEVMTYPFVSLTMLELLKLDVGRHLKLKNPRSEEQAYLRTTMIAGLLQAMVNNTRTQPEFSLFEIGQVYLPSTSAQPDEVERVGIIAQSKQSAYMATKNALDQLMAEHHIKAKVVPIQSLPFLHPGLQAEITAGGTSIGYIGEIHPMVLGQLKLKYPVGYVELWLDGLFKHARLPVFQPVSPFPTVVRDVTVCLANEVMWQDVQHAIAASQLAWAAYIGDFYQTGSGERFLTIRLTIIPTTKTFREAEIDRRVREVVSLLKRNFKARLKD